jgi:hypothetical protein
MDLRKIQTRQTAHEFVLRQVSDESMTHDEHSDASSTADWPSLPPEDPMIKVLRQEESSATMVDESSQDMVERQAQNKSRGSN